MKSQVLPITLLLIALSCIWSGTVAVSISGLQKRAIPKALYLSCHGGKISKACAATLEEAWTDGKMKTVTSQHQHYTAKNGQCTVRFWGEENIELEMKTVHQYTAALEQIDQYCDLMGITAQDPLNDFSGFSGTFIGNLNSHYVVLVFKT